MSGLVSGSVGAMRFEKIFDRQTKNNNGRDNYIMMLMIMIVTTRIRRRRGLDLHHRPDKWSLGPCPVNGWSSISLLTSSMMMTRRTRRMTPPMIMMNLAIMIMMIIVAMVLMITFYDLTHPVHLFLIYNKGAIFFFALIMITIQKILSTM